jgi:anaerobic selenocysteine-containing dehydrogenase
VEVIAELGARLLADSTPINWREMTDTNRIRDAIGRIVPGWEQIAEIGRTKKEFHLPGRILHQPVFPTKSGRARLHIHDLPELSAADGALRLMTVRSEGQFNTVVYEDEDLYRGQERRDVILLHPADIARLGLSAESRVSVRSEVGELKAILVRAFEKIKPGNALMYYPEANTLVPRHIDPASKTPAFKNVLVWLARSGGTPAAESSVPLGDARQAAASRAGMRSC